MSPTRESVPTSDLAERLIRLHEGLRLTAYRCSAGKLTIGHGRNIEDIGITREEADYLLVNDLSRVEAELHAQLPWVTRLDPVRWAVLCDMAYNLGLGKLLQFTRTLSLIEGGDYAAAAGAMLQSKWATQVGTRAQRLAAMMATGTVPPEVAAP
jgi:lysozyme